MICRYLADCSNCSQYHPDNQDEEKCDILGLSIGDGSSVCKYFSCTIQECPQSDCMSYEDQLSMKEGF